MTLWSSAVAGTVGSSGEGFSGALARGSLWSMGEVRSVSGL
jgi:hypothetical protein